MLSTRLAAALCVTLALVAAPPAVAAEGPPGPRLATVELIETATPKGFDREPEPLMSLATVDPATGGERRFVRGKLAARKLVVPLPFAAPAWSSDGRLIAFASDGAEGRLIYVFDPDGSGLRPLPGTRNGTTPVFSPDGHTLAFARTRFHSHIPRNFFKHPLASMPRIYSSETTWVVDLAGGKPRRLTPWRNGLYNTPGSFAADGSSLLVTKEDSHLPGKRIVQLGLAGGSPQEILFQASEPSLSPDGTQLAFVGYADNDVVEAEENHDYLAGEIYVAGPDGSGARRLTRTDDVIESSPSWDPSGERIAYVEAKADTSFIPELANLFPLGNHLVQINADGTCRQQILSRPRVAFYGVAWQPGPGREAGRIAC
jgi:Tol biopolymer transport system component